MPVLKRPLAAIAAALAALALIHGAVQAQQAQDDDDDDDLPAAPLRETLAGPPPKLPTLDLTRQTLYDYLYGEIAAQRGDPGLAAQTLLELSKRTRDPRIARRAVEVANFARMPGLALESARIWHDADPASPQALQAISILLVGAKRAEEAEPFIAKLFATDATAPANGFMTLGRLLAANPDAQANLRVTRTLAARYPNLPQAHYAVAQMAAAANDEALALEEARRATALRPDWETGVLFEAQLLQRRSPGDATKRLAAYLEKHPDSRDVRLGHARALVLDKRYPEARAEFESILKRFPKDIDAVYAVGLLAFQAKEYAIAETNMKRLLELGYRDANTVRFTLGQIAEEQKNWAGAIQWYETIQRGEQAMAARMRTANALSKQGKLADARAYLRGVKALDEPQRVQLLIAESQLLRDANLNREAFDLLGQELQKTPDQPELLYDHALTAEKLERFDILESNLKRLIQIKPDHAHAYNALGYSYAERNLNLPEAKQLIEKALEISPSDYFIIDSLGWVLYRMGDLQGAARELRRAWQGRPDGEIGAHLGEVLWAIGERDEARRVWQESIKVSPDNDTLRKTLKRFVP